MTFNLYQEARMEDAVRTRYSNEPRRMQEEIDYLTTICTGPSMTATISERYGRNDDWPWDVQQRKPWWRRAFTP